jgi:hypothetical protein
VVTLPAGHTVVNAWNAQLTVGGATVTARNMPYNGNLSPSRCSSRPYVLAPGPHDRHNEVMLHPACFPPSWIEDT